MDDDAWREHSRAEVFRGGRRTAMSKRDGDAASARAEAGDHVTETRHTHNVFWVRYMRLGMLMNLLTALGLFVYLRLAPHRPHEPALRAIAVVGVFAVLVMAALQAQRVAGTRWRWPFFYAWTIADILLVAWAVVLDGGGDSPLALGLFLPLLYVAMAYPPGGVVVIAAIEVVTFAAVSLSDHAADGTPYEVLLGMVLALCGLMAVVGARHRALQARAFTRIRRRLAEDALVDELTGCANRRAFFDALAAEAARAVRHRRPLALLSVDIDQFKQVNDTYGHPAGDQVLVALADVLRAQTRAGDLVARLGGDEFSIVLPECARADAERLVLRLHQATVAVAGVPPVRISVGLAVADGTAPIDATALVSGADQALYDAKRTRHEVSLPPAVAG